MRIDETGKARSHGLKGDIMIHGKKLLTAQLLAAGLGRDDIVEAAGISKATYYRYAKDEAVQEYVQEYRQDIGIRDEAVEALRKAVRRGSVPAIRLALAQFEPKGQNSNSNDGEPKAVTIIDDIPDLATALNSMCARYGKTDTLRLIKRELDKIPDASPPTKPLASSVFD